MIYYSNTINAPSTSIIVKSIKTIKEIYENKNTNTDVEQEILFTLKNIEKLLLESNDLQKQFRIYMAKKGVKNHH